MRWPPFQHVIFDCDSTLTTVEGIDALAKSAGKGWRVSVLTEAAMMFPPWTFSMLRKLGGSAAALRRNIYALIGMLALCLAIYALIETLLPADQRAVIGTVAGFEITSNLVQWLAIAIGGYAAFSWIQSVRLRDKVTFALTLGGQSYRLMAMCGGVLGIYTYGTSAFVYVYGNRYLGLEPTDGFTLGLIAVIGGTLGTFLGGWLGDMAKLRNPAGRVYLLFVAMIGFSVTLFLQYMTQSKTVFFALHFVSLMLLTTWVPIMVATAQDLVIPRLRGAGFAVQTLCSTFTGLGLGPYVIGVISDITGDLRFAILTILIVMPLLLVLLWRLARSLPEGEASVVERARAAGEPIGG